MNEKNQKIIAEYKESLWNMNTMDFLVELESVSRPDYYDDEYTFMANQKRIVAWEFLMTKYLHLDAEQVAEVHAKMPERYAHKEDRVMY
jgi:hypothetical protein